MDITKDIRNLKGIGVKTAQLYNKVGIYTYGDLMYYYPRDYMHFGEPVFADDDSIGKLCFVKVTVKERPLLKRAGRMAVVSLKVYSKDSVIRTVWFHMPYVVKKLIPGNDYIFCSELKKSGSSYSMDQPLIFEPEEYEKVKSTLQPIYPLTKGLSNNSLKKSIKQVLDMYKDEDTVLDMPRRDALFCVHFPKDVQELKKAREVMVYEEFLTFILRLRMLREENSRAVNSYDIAPSDKVHDIMNSLPYTLTAAQLKVFNEVEKDLTGNNSMSRLIQGDVGCGKTIIAVLACLTVCLSGFQCAVMVPTEVLAAQHLKSFDSLIRESGLDIKTVLLTGSMKKSQKDAALEMAESGEAGIIIGTHALFQEKVRYKKLALVITDEQHRFGVRQRGYLVQKGDKDVPHVLVMSATPIPRTLAIMLYGDLDISVIDEVPSKRLPIKNCVVPTGYRKKAYEFISGEVKKGHQAYVICPMVEESEGLDVKDVISYTDELKSFLDDGIRIEYLHGRMKPAKKDEIMSDFLSGKIDVLVSTTVVEVGVNVPNATVMMIENAERFGLAQLHQLRGRIGRGDAQSYCIFINCNDSEKSRSRLDILNKSNDGFKIASEDLKQRGPGDMFGIRQSGELQFKLADIYTDSGILKKASDDADSILKNDPGLESKENSYIKKRLDEISQALDIHAL